MNKRLIIAYPRWYVLLLFSIFILYGGYLWSVGWESPYYRVLHPANYVLIGVVAFILELKFVTASVKHLTVWWLFVPFRRVAWKDITSITIIQKANDERDDSVRVLITIAPCVYRTDMALTAAEFARQHLIKGIFFRISKNNPEETIRKLKEFCPHFEIPYMTQ